MSKITLRFLLSPAQIEDYFMLSADSCQHSAVSCQLSAFFSFFLRMASAMSVKIQMKSRKIARISPLRLGDGDLDVFIVVVFCEIVHTSLDSREPKGRDEDAAGGVAGLGAEVDTDSFAVGYVAYLRHVLLEAR